MKNLFVNISNGYNIEISEELLKSSGGAVRALTAGNKIAIVTDDTVYELYYGVLRRALSDAGFEVFSFVIKHGERSKSFANFKKILEFLAERGFTRKDTLVALGGGVVGDLTGFAASAYMRGIPFIQYPTTLLAGIDSSVGGKTAVNLPAGKNLAGSFYQPKGVFFDVNTLNTLNEQEILNGSGELIKYGILCGGELWELIKRGRAALFKRENLERAIELCLDYKRKTVEEDERETGSARRLLNLGHTAAHAVDKLSAYKISHGIAVAIGIRLIASAAHREGALSQREFSEIENALADFRLPCGCAYSAKEIAECARLDKKSAGDKITIVVVDRIGGCRSREVDFKTLEEYLCG